MSWTDHFPVIESSTDESPDTPGASSILELLNVGQQFSTARPEAHIISTSASWASISLNEEPYVDAATAKNCLNVGGDGGAKAWLGHVGRVLKQIEIGKANTVLRVYLSPELAHWAEPLFTAGCEVALMAHSAAFAPLVGLWRLLALEENRPMTIIDPRLLSQAMGWASTTEQLIKDGLGFWREPGLRQRHGKDLSEYRPIPNLAMGGQGNIPIRNLLKTMEFQQVIGRLKPSVRSATGVEKPLIGGLWPQVGYDDWLLMCCVYPLVAQRGLMTLVGQNHVPPVILALDVEYATWANPKATVVPLGLGKSWRMGPTLDIKQCNSLLPLGATRIIATNELTQSHPLPGHAWRGEVLHGVSFSETVVSHFNPASIIHYGHRWLAYRTECLPFWKWGLVSLARLTDECVVIEGSNRRLELPTAFGDWCAEDPRFFIHQDRLFLYYTDNWTGGLAEIDEKGRVLNAALFPKSAQGVRPDRNRHDKNWGFFSRGGVLYAVYWTCPHVVREVDLIDWQFGREWRTSWAAPIPGNAKLHGGSSPVLHGNLLWRTVHHHEVPEDDPGGRRYVIWLMAFEPDPPFRPRVFCNNPILIGESQVENPLEGWRNWAVVFCSSIERDVDGWKFFFGHNDRRMRWGKVSDTALAPHLLDIP